MDEKNARDILTTHIERKPSEIGEAVDILYETFGNYASIAQEFGRSNKFWRVRHRFFQLPEGIRWKIDEGQIDIGQGEQILKLENEEDQWLLAIAIIETESFTAAESGNVVNLVLKEKKSIREALSVAAGIRFDKPHPLLLPLPFNIWLAICKRAWVRCQNWEDLTYQLILQGLEVDPEEVACQLEKLALDLRKAGGAEKDCSEVEVDGHDNQLKLSKSEECTNTTLETPS